MDDQDAGDQDVDWDLGEELTLRLRELHEANKARIFVTFTQDAGAAPVNAQGVSKAERRTFGPYRHATIGQEGKLYIEAKDRG